jgi:hypothetical protein
MKIKLQDIIKWTEPEILQQFEHAKIAKSVNTRVYVVSGHQVTRRRRRKLIVGALQWPRTGACTRLLTELSLSPALSCLQKLIIKAAGSISLIRVSALVNTLPCAQARETTWPKFIGQLIRYWIIPGKMAQAPARQVAQESRPFLICRSTTNQPTNGVAASACFSIMIIRTLSFLMCVSGEFKGGQLLPRTPLGAECARNT